MKSLYLFLLFVFLISTASALSVQKTALTDVIIPEFNQPARFSLKINTASAGNYNIYTLTDVKLMPTTSFILAEGTNNLDIYIYPTPQLDVRGFYTFGYTLKGPEELSDKLTIKITDLKDAIEINSDSNDLETGKINFYIRNKENTQLENVNVKLSSVFFKNLEKTISLDAYEKLEISVDVDKDKLKKILAGSYLVKAEFQTDKGKQILEGTIYLGEKKGIETQTDSSGILIRTKTITKVNIGNIQEIVNIKIKKNIFTRLFTTFNYEPDLVERKASTITYSWNKKLNPAEIIAIKAKTNYIYPILIIILAIILIKAFRHYTQTKIEVRKSISRVKTKSGQFALKIRLNVKAKKNIENVSIFDKIPAMLKVYNKFGTLKPTKFDTSNRRLQWDLGDLNAGEERVFNYIAYSKISVIGKFSLPSATAVFEKDNEIHETESNQVFYLSEQVRREGD